MSGTIVPVKQTGHRGTSGSVFSCGICYNNTTTQAPRQPFPRPGIKVVNTPKDGVRLCTPGWRGKVDGMAADPTPLPVGGSPELLDSLPERCYGCNRRLRFKRATTHYLPYAERLMEDTSGVSPYRYMRVWVYHPICEKD